MKNLFPSALLLTLFLILTNQSATAGSATWNLNPGDYDWNTAANWTPMTVPNGSVRRGELRRFKSNDRAAYPRPQRLAVLSLTQARCTFSVQAENSSTTFTLSGPGVVNNSGALQSFVIGSDCSGDAQNLLMFKNSASAGTLTNYTVDPGEVARFAGGAILFFESSQAGSGSFFVNAPTVRDAIGGIVLFMDTTSAESGTFTVAGGTSGSGGEVDFDGSASAGSATFTINGAGGVNAEGGVVVFTDDSTAGNGTFMTNGPSNGGVVGGLANFEGSATAGDAILVANPGSGFQFMDSSDGGAARIEAFGSSSFNIASTMLCLESLSARSKEMEQFR